MFFVVMARQRRFTSKKIIDSEEILTNKQILEEEINLNTLKFESHLSCVQWFARHRLIANSRNCENCDREMTFVTRGTDSFQWNCSRCHQRKSVRLNSFFAQSQFKLHECIKLIYFWAKEFTQKTMWEELGRRPTARNAVSEWCSSCREICEVHLQLL